MEKFGWTARDVGWSLGGVGMSVEEFEGLLSIARDADRDPAGLQEFESQFLVDLVVLHQQDVRPAQLLLSFHHGVVDLVRTGTGAQGPTNDGQISNI